MNTQGEVRVYLDGNTHLKRKPGYDYTWQYNWPKVPHAFTLIRVHEAYVEVRTWRNPKRMVSVFNYYYDTDFTHWLKSCMQFNQTLLSTEPH